MKDKIEGKEFSLGPPRKVEKTGVTHIKMKCDKLGNVTEVEEIVEVRMKLHKVLGNTPEYEAVRVITEQALTKAKEEEREECIDVVRRMTEIPAGAKNPTRDTTVILGEKLIKALTSKE